MKATDQSQEQYLTQCQLLHMRSLNFAKSFANTQIATSNEQTVHPSFARYIQIHVNASWLHMELQLDAVTPID